MTILLGIDFGSTNLKGVAYDTAGRVAARASARTPVTLEQAGQALYPPAEVWRAAAGVIRAIVSQLAQPAEIAGVAFTSLGESVVPLDRAGGELFPALAWFDERTRPVAQPWLDEALAANAYRITGQVMDYTFSAFKALWFCRQHPALAQKVRNWLPMADYLAFELTGTARISESLASRTMLLDLRRRAWSEELIAALGLDRDPWPEPVPGGDPLGTVTAAAAALTGLREGTPVFAGGHDHPCGALAAGVFAPGVVLDSMGTTEALATTVLVPPADPEMGKLAINVSCHAAPGRYCLIFSQWGAGSLYHWLGGVLAAGAAPEAAADVDALAASSPPGARGVQVLPYFAGADPHLPAPEMKGMILGLNLGHSPADLARATLEGLCFEIRLMLADLERVAGTSLHELRLVGGNSAPRAWRRIKADATGRRIVVPELTEAGCQGAAILAGIGAGIYRDPADALARINQAGEAIEPDPERRAGYEQRYKQDFLPARRLAASWGRRANSG